MNKIYLFVFALVAGAFSCFAQTTQLNETFASPFNLSASGWYQQNNSNPVGSQTWAQGVGTVFAAYSGNADDYYRNNYNSQGTTSGSISDWLITPTVSLMNAGVLKFYSRTKSNPTNYPDRLDVQLSVGNGTGSIPNSVSGVGTFSINVLTINPNLTGTSYPATWTLFTATLTGIMGTVAGRFAFRYDVPNGGLNGVNSDYIGIDDVVYTTAPPCPSPYITVTPPDTMTCEGDYVEVALGGASTYTIDGDPVFLPTVGFSPASTHVYTVTGTSAQGCFGTNTFTINAVPRPTVSVSNATACPGANATLVATGANTYSWSNGATTSSIVIPVTANTFYSVMGFAFPGGCYDYRTASVHTDTFLSVQNENVVTCPDVPYIIGASGASTYTWSTGATTPSIVITPTGSASYFVTGTSAGCNETKKVNVTISPDMFAPSFTTCAGTAATLIATGADTYTWNTGATNSMIVVSPTANATYTVVGSSGSCNQTKTVSVSLSNNLSIVTTQSCSGAVVVLHGYGASSYTWYPTIEHTPFIFVNPSGPAVYTLSGSSGTCSGIQTVAFDVCPGIKEFSMKGDNISVFPNPFYAEFTINGANGQFVLVNTVGQVLVSGNMFGSVSISTESMPPGIYFVVITESDSATRTVRKLLKN